MSTGVKKRISEDTTFSPEDSSDPPMFDSTDAKKVKLTESVQPSRVIHMRNVPSDATEAEILYLGLLFGIPTNVLVMRGAKKYQAFLEMPDESSATKFINYYSTHPAVIRGREVYMQFSTYRQLNIDEKQASATAALAHAMASQLFLFPAPAVGLVHPQMEHIPPHPHPVPLLVGAVDPSELPAASIPAFTEEQQVAVEEDQPPVEGCVGSESVEAAEAEAQAVSVEEEEMENNGAAGCVVADEESAKPILCIIMENLKMPISLDLLHSLFSNFGDVLRIVTFFRNNQHHALLEYSDASMASAAKTALNGQYIHSWWCRLKISYSKLEKLAVRRESDRAKDFTKESPACDYPEVPSVPLASLPHGGPSPLGFSSLPAGPLLAGNMLLSGMGPAHGPAAIPGQSPVSPIPHLFASNGIGPALSTVGIQQPGSVLIVSNLKESVVTPQVLFTLFGVYGFVMRVKILFNKRDTALVQFADPAQARLAIQCLNGVVLFTKKLHINISTHAIVQLPRDDHDSHLTQDYSQSNLHRYSRNGLDVRKIYAPSRTLHLSNFALSTPGEEVTELFTKAGYNVEKFQWYRAKNDEKNRQAARKMALIQLASTDEATEALIMLHNYQFSDGYRMCVSFAKNPTIH
eukprot:m.62653 g.62653  ORF g.62653 m.62653 type:complete len:634 (+) comp35095_c0_seq1:207-2108(+)